MGVICERATNLEFSSKKGAVLVFAAGSCQQKGVNWTFSVRASLAGNR